jgi:hypothetical protein
VFRSLGFERESAAGGTIAGAPVVVAGFLQKRTTRAFVYYRWAFALLIAIAALAGR